MNSLELNLESKVCCNIVEVPLKLMKWNRTLPGSPRKRWTDNVKVAVEGRRITMTDCSGTRQLTWTDSDISSPLAPHNTLPILGPHPRLSKLHTPTEQYLKYSESMQTMWRLELCPRPRWGSSQRSPDPLGGERSWLPPPPKPQPPLLALWASMFGPSGFSVPHPHSFLTPSSFIFLEICLGQKAAA